MLEPIAATPGLSQVLQSFLAGVFVSLTPCVYPLIPITLSIFGASGDKISRTKGFLLAFCYVLGIATTYTCLGLFSALSGNLFGSALSSPIVVVTLSTILILMALSTLDLIGSGPLGKIQNLASRVGGKGFKGAFLMGTVSGFVAAPCVGPALVVILSVAASAGNALWGALLLFAYAMGFGMLFLVLGSFPSLLGRMPRSGNWLMGIKFILAVALVATAIFLSQQYVLKWLPDLIFTQALVAVALLGAGLLLAYFSYAKSLGPLKLLAALAVAISICPLIYVRGDSHSYNWNNSIEGALDQARTNSQITMVDFYADWCAACKELEVLTFSNPLVQAELEKIALARLDFTNPNDELSEKYNIAGLPCILFLRTDGSEIENSRITGFLSADDFLQHLAQIKNSL